MGLSRHLSTRRRPTRINTSNSLLTIRLPINKLSSEPCSQGHPDCHLNSLVHRSSEERHVVTAHQENGYPSHLIQKHRTQGRQRQDISEKLSARVTLPYIQRMSEAIRRVLGELDIQTLTSRASEGVSIVYGMLHSSRVMLERSL